MTPNYKVVTLGDYGCGKTSLVQRFVRKRNIVEGELSPTIDANFSLFTFNEDGTGLDDTMTVMGLWDTAGSERFLSLSKLYYRDAFATLVCYDVSNFRSWARVTFWVNELKGTNSLIYIVGCKSDLPRKICPDNACSYAKSIGAFYFETSSRTGSQIDELFTRVYHDYLDSSKRNEKKSGGRNSLDISSGAEGSSYYKRCSC
ncbi:RAB24 [Lepeophtheirus salmonis]|uniref:RAB24 n=3 Tax=Lepeophtheirus salmonis TaxID=72036 RepID=A0A7R8H9J2_LEPSM|nr:RAB24 [Lepeophtheirus salmonis]CAF2959442.1 RAB24 [Lepeophtheirus salmonis]